MKRFIENDEAYRQGFKDGMDSQPDDPSAVIGIIFGAIGGFVMGMSVAALLHWLT